MPAKSSNLLVVDTAMNACTVVVQRADGRMFFETRLMERGQAEALMPMIQSAVAQAELTLPQIDTYACVVGPGTFTGLRVGLATVRALAQVSGKPTVPVSTFDALAASIQAQAPVAILIETKRTDFYLRAPGRADSCVTIEDLKAIIQPDWILVGDAVKRAARDADFDDKAVSLDCASAEGLVACARMGAAGVLEPVYLRDADVSISRQKIAQIAD
jgi:tRNA threonylcarbamoyladenosine biosynthesis protein TsaB